MIRQAAVAAVAVLFAAPVPAHAATVSATAGGSGPYGVPAGSVLFEAAPGEANRVTIGPVPNSRGLVAVREDGAPLSAGARCTLITTAEAVCDTGASDFISVTVNAGDGSDQVRIDEPIYGIVNGGPGDDSLAGGCQADGGPGDDTLVGCANTLPALGHRFTGGPGADSIQGGPAADVIDGGGGRDLLQGGDGNDEINDGDGPVGAADVADGGGGVDTVSYASRKSGVHVDLANPDAPQGSAGEDDRLRNVENVLGGPGDDSLLGDGNANRLDGGAGADAIDGRGGPDELLDGAGRDVVRGGPGGDHLITRDLYRDTVSCGSGADRLLSDPGDDVAPGCEGSDNTRFRLVSYPRLGAASRRISFRVRCLDLDELTRTVAREFEACHFSAVLRVRVHHRWKIAGRTTCRIDACAPLVLSRSSWHELRVKHSLAASLRFVRSPSLGALPHTDNVQLKLHQPA